MIINLTFSKTFDRWYESFRAVPVGEKLLKLEGIHPEQLDVGNMSHKYFTDEVCNISVDANLIPAPNSGLYKPHLIQ